MNVSLRAAVVLGCVLAGCDRGGASKPSSAPGPVKPAAPAAAPRARTAQAAPEAAVREAVRAANDFGFDLWRRARPKDQNFVLSPWSVNHALAMTSAGARGETAQSLARVLRRKGDDEGWHLALGTLEAALTSRGAGKKGKDGGPFRLSVFNQLYAASALPLEQPFVDRLGESYGAKVRRVDFAGAAEAARGEINADVREATANLIPALLGPGTVDASTTLTLVNAVYFNASWAKRFDVSQTRPKPFFRDDGKKVEVQMMHDGDLPARVSGKSRSGELMRMVFGDDDEGAEKKPRAQSKAAGGDSDGVEVLQLPYDGSEVALVVLMPPQGKLARFEEELTHERLEALLARPAIGSAADVALPRFDLRSQSALVPPLSALGLNAALQSTADFTGISPQRPLFISQVVHEAVVKTDEGGTEAAAATAVVLGKGGLPEVGFIEVNRPFLFLIRDTATGAVLFLGRYVGP